MSHPACVLFGGYGYGNVGDRLALAVALRDARRRFGSSVAVLSHRPEATRRAFPEATVIGYGVRRPPWIRRRLRRIQRAFEKCGLRPPFHVHRYILRDQARTADGDAPAWMDLVRNADCLYMVGGGYLTDLFDVESYLLPLELAQQESVAIETAPIGIGPFRRADLARRTAAALRTAKIVVRDDRSLEFCRRHGIVAERHPDDGFRVGEVLPEWPQWIAGRGERQRDGAAPRIAVCACEQFGANAPVQTARWWLGALEELVRCGAEVEGICFHDGPDTDHKYIAGLFAEAGIDPRRARPPRADFRESVGDLLDYDAVISARFHAAVVACAAGIPCAVMAAGVYAATKTNSIAEVHPELVFAVRPERHGPQELLERLLRAVDSPPRAGGRVAVMSESDVG